MNTTAATLSTSGQRYTTADKRAIFADNSNDMTSPSSFDLSSLQAASKRILAGDMVDGIDGYQTDIADIGFGETEEERKEAKVQRLIQQTAVSNLLEQIDNKIAEIDFQLFNTRKERSILEARQGQIDIEKGALKNEEQAIQEDIDAVNAAKQAEEAEQEAKEVVTEAEQNLENSQSIGEAIHNSEKLESAKERLAITEEEKAKRIEIIKSRGLDPETLSGKMEEWLKGQEQQLAKIHDQINVLEENKVENAARIEELKISEQELLAKKDDFLELKKNIETDPAHSTNIENGVYKTIGDLVDNLTTELKETANSLLNAFVSNEDNWSKFMDKLNSEKNVSIFEKHAAQNEAGASVLGFTEDEFVLNDFMRDLENGGSPEIPEVMKEIVARSPEFKDQDISTLTHDDFSTMLRNQFPNGKISGSILMPGSLRDHAAKIMGQSVEQAPSTQDAFVQNGVSITTPKDSVRISQNKDATTEANASQRTVTSNAESGIKANNMNTAFNSAVQNDNDNTSPQKDAEISSPDIARQQAQYAARNAGLSAPAA